ncbi:MAG: CoA transferase [Rhodoferax sp.]
MQTTPPLSPATQALALAGLRVVEFTTAMTGAPAALLEAHDLPLAPIRRPEELFDDAHLLATGGLAAITLPDGARAGQTKKAPLFPFMLGGQRLGVRLQPPTLGQHTTELQIELGYSSSLMKTLRVNHAIA